MNDRFVIRIRKRTLPEVLVWCLVMMPFMLGLLCEMLGLPYAVRYIADIIWVVLLVLVLVHRNPLKKQLTYKLAWWILFFWGITAVFYLAYFQSALYYIWGVRNLFRFYATFFICSMMLTGRDVDGYMKLFDILFWINAIVSVIQFYVYDIAQDELGGLFSAQGGNGFTNIFMLIMVSKSVLEYIEKKVSLFACALTLFAAVAVAAMSEIKFFFVEIAIVVVLAANMTGFSWRKTLLFFGSVIAILLGVAALTQIFPAWGEWFSLEWFWNTAFTESGYTGSGDLNRLNAISRINELWLQSGWQRVFGLGLGNCDTSTYAILNTPFFESYGHYHYTWLSYALVYLETGWVGLVFFWGFFALTYLEIYKIEKKSDSRLGIYCRLGRIMAVMCVIISIYNSSLRAESGYMAYFVMAIPFALSRGKSNKNNG